SYAIRRLCPGDLETLRALNALFGEVFDERETYAGDPPSDEYCRDLLGREDLLLVVAIQDERVIGGLAAYLLRKYEQARSEIYIYDLAVAEENRRRGVTTALIAEVRRIGRGAGTWTVFVQTSAERSVGTPCAH